MASNSSKKAVRIAFLVDGFNLYHSLDEAQDKHRVAAKWLDLKAFCSSFLQLIGTNARLGPIHYFSALAVHMEDRKPGVTARHNLYLRGLRETGVEVELGQFKEKWIKCGLCKREFKRHEEKETDVAIGTRLLDLFWTGQCDAAAIISADSDMAPAIRSVLRRFPGTSIYSIQPWGRGSFELRGLAATTFKVKAHSYGQHQLPNPFLCKDGTSLAKPVNW